MTRRLVMVMTVLAVGVALALAIPMGIILSGDMRSAFISKLEVDTLATSTSLALQPKSQWPGTIASAADRTGARVVIVDTKQSLVADSDETAVDRSFNRPEILQALSGTLTSSVRPSVTLGTDLRYVAAPVVKGEKIIAAVRLSLPESDVMSLVHRSQLWLAFFVVAVMLIAAFVAWIIASSIAAPLSRVADIAERLPDDLSLRAPEDDGPPEVQAVASSLNQTAERLTGILERTQAVAADASHHLKTPLTGLRLRLEAIEDLTDQDEIRIQAERATAEVDRLTHRIDQVLALARSDTGAALHGTADASLAIVERLDEASVIAVERGLVLESLVDPGIEVLVTAAALARVIDELLGNAFAYARSRVEVTLSVQGAFAQLVVEDDGPGLPAEEMGTIFNRFVR
ncbi:MAG: histidine kinase dimerization/phospho-acceptor domain-containing protein, partial [Candidatus Nanopelagicales bacterium]